MNITLPHGFQPDMVRYATMEDVHFLAPRLRAADIQEVADVCGITGLESLTLGLEKSDHCFTLAYGGVPFAMLGVVEEKIKGMGRIWMHCTDDIPRLPFLRRTKAILHDVIGRQLGYEYVYNVVDSRNDLHIQWLRWIGATFYTEDVYTCDSGVNILIFTINTTQRRGLTCVP